MTVVDTPEREIVLSILALVDMTLVANLLIMVIFSGYENFVSKIDVDNHEDKPHCMGKVDYSGLKRYEKILAQILQTNIKGRLLNPST